MNNKNITISLFRVSADSLYIDMMFDCPEEYYFNSLFLEVRYFDKVMKSQFFDLSNALFNVDPDDPNNTINKKHWVVRLPLDKLGILVPAIYKGTLKAQPIIDESSDDSETECTPELEPLEDCMVCSDVNYAYKCMLKDLLDLSDLADPCLEISDEAIRKYLLLYGHQAALSTGDEEAAEVYFKLISNCFEQCGQGACGCCPTDRPKPIIHKSNCNCGK